MMFKLHSTITPRSPSIFSLNSETEYSIPSSSAGPKILINH